MSDPKSKLSHKHMLRLYGKCMVPYRFENFCRECIIADNQRQDPEGDIADRANDAVESFGPQRTQSTGSTTGAVLEFAGQSAFTKRPRQRRGAIVTGVPQALRYLQGHSIDQATLPKRHVVVGTEAEETFEWQGRQMPVSMRGVLLSTDIEQDNQKMTKKEKKKRTQQRKARGGAVGETDSRYAASVELQPAGATSEAPAPSWQAQDPQQVQEQREVAGGSVTSSASPQTSDDEQGYAKARRPR